LFDIVKFKDNECLKVSSISKKKLKEPYAFDWFFSNHIDIINRLEAYPKRLSEYGTCENACATSDAYKLKDFLLDISKDKFDPKKHLKIINTGTIDKYIPRWGNAPMTYLGDKYLAPVVNKKMFLNSFTNTYGIKSVKPKVIIKGLTLLDACIDENGIIIPGKTTLIITENNQGNSNLKFLLSLLNSKLSLFYIKEKYRGSSYNEGINFNVDMINNIPLPVIELPNKRTLEKLIDFIIQQKNNARDAVFFIKLIDAIVYELYFTQAIKSAHCEILKYLNSFPRLKDDWSNKKKLVSIDKVYKVLSDPKHPVSVAMEKMKTVPEVRIIEGLS